MVQSPEQLRKEKLTKMEKVQIQLIWIQIQGLKSAEKAEREDVEYFV